MHYCRLTEYCLFVSTLATGFYAGIGFFGNMGHNPTVKLLSENSFAEYWQHLDNFMAARMKIFGPLMLLCLLTTTVILLKEYNKPSFWCLLAALMICITDVVFTLTTNHPLNTTVQSWDLNNLPSNVRDVKQQITNAFDKRQLLMVGSFIMVLLSVWLRRPL